jgi:hypothetical protein
LRVLIYLVQYRQEEQTLTVPLRSENQRRGCTNSGSIEFCTVAPNICNMITAVFSYIQKCLSVHGTKQNTPDNSEVQMSLQNCKFCMQLVSYQPFFFFRLEFGSVS